MAVNAILTNTFSSIIYALLLFFFSCSFSLHFIQHDPAVSLLIVLYTWTLFILEIVASYAHRYSPMQHLSPPWIMISLLLILLNYLMAHSLDMPQITRVVIICLSLVSAFLFLTHNGKFIYIATFFLVVNVIEAYYSPSLARIGFIVMACANLVWILTRQIENALLGREIPVKYRYDNDVFHLLCIIGTSVFYYSIHSGQWQYPTHLYC